MKPIIIFVLVSLAVVIIAFSGVAVAGDTIKFAVVGPMTGDGAAMGIHEKNGAKMAMDEINSAGGINGKKLEFVVGDDDQNPNLATIVAQKVTSDKNILFTVGHVNSSCSLSSLPIYEKKGMPLISGANTNPQLTQLGHKNYFRIIASDAIAVKQIYSVGTEVLNIKKPAIMWENTDYGKGLRDMLVEDLKEGGFKLLGEASYLPGTDRDFSAHITKFKGMGVDGVFLMGNYNASALFLKQSATFGFKAKFVAGGGAASAKLIEIAGAAAEGFMVVTAYDPNDERARQKAFSEKYIKTFNEPPNEWSSHAYDIVYLVKQAIEKGGTDRASLIAKLREVNYPGVTGDIKFDKNGDVPFKKQFVLKVQGGRFVTVE
jgi:branched-chain amino acid transport system substrate-binding protein